MAGPRPFVSICCCAKFTLAGVVTFSCLLGYTLWASEEATRDSRPPSFLQMTSSHRFRVRHEHELRKDCPAELLRRYSDCRVVEVRANFKVGDGSIRPPAGEHTRMVWSAVVADGEMGSIVGWNPVMVDVRSTCPGEANQVSLVHHINVYAYDAKTALTPGRAYEVERSDALKRMGIDESSFRMLASHDKEAGQYVLPAGYGIPFRQRALMERHILVPECWDYSKEIPELSGMDLYVTSQSTKPASLVGALNFNMDVQPKQGPVDWITRVSADRLKTLVPTEQDEMPEILAVHLHTHDVAKSKFFEVLNSDGSVAFRSEKEKAGYGLQEQSFANLPEKGWPRLRLRAGQQLLQHCLFDSDHLRGPVEYGLSWGQEMCAPLLVIGGSGLRLVPTVLSEADGYLSRLHGLWEEVSHDAKRLLLELRSAKGPPLI